MENMYTVEDDKRTTQLFLKEIIIGLADKTKTSLPDSYPDPLLLAFRNPDSRNNLLRIRILPILQHHYPFTEVPLM